MVKLLILYYLNIKSTHGYEIQKFIQVNGYDVWTKIKSGSIYYALSKMEKSKEVEIAYEENVGSRTRKIYKITEKGKETLKLSIKEELKKSLSIATEKFILPIAFNRLEKDKAIPIIRNHIEELKKSLEYWNYWKEAKVSENATKTEAISFEMNIANIEYDIKWHEALIEEYDTFINLGKSQELMIENLNFDDIDGSTVDKSKNIHDKISKLRETILGNPENSKDALDELIKLAYKKNK